MGTRNLTAVYVDGEYKIAQYGQWDGYPQGQGMTCLNFAKKFLANKTDREAFAEKVRTCSWITDEEIAQVSEKIRREHILGWSSIWPELSRDTGANILEIVQRSEPGLKLKNDIDFAAESLFCEWAWVIDLDAGTFEGYRGFNQSKKLKPDDRFYFLVEKEKHGYMAITLAAKWSLDELPEEDAFLEAFNEEEEE